MARIIISGQSSLYFSGGPYSLSLCWYLDQRFNGLVIINRRHSDLWLYVTKASLQTFEYMHECIVFHDTIWEVQDVDFTSMLVPLPSMPCPSCVPHIGGHHRSDGVTKPGHGWHWEFFSPTLQDLFFFYFSIILFVVYILLILWSLPFLPLILFLLFYLISIPSLID